MRNRNGGKRALRGLLMAGALLTAGCWDDDDGEDGDGGQSGIDRYSQVDRMGIPALNTVFNHASLPPFSKLAYNQKGPQTDLADYRTQFMTVLGAVKNEDAAGTAGLLLPDELPVDLAADSTSFASLNGRRLQDDAVDVALTVTVGDSLAHLRSDNVDSNDKAFLSEFPFLAAPH